MMCVVLSSLLFMLDEAEYTRTPIADKRAILFECSVAPASPDSDS